MDMSRALDRVTLALADAGLALRETGKSGSTLHFVVDGDTYHNRELIKQQGGRWLPSHQRWFFSFDGAGAPAGLAEATAPAFTGPPVVKQRHYHGHRDRLRQRFVEVSPQALADYELLELLLFFSIYRRDTKPLAKALIARFGSLGGVLAAEPQRYGEVMGLEPLSTADPDRSQVRDDDLRFTQVLLKSIQALLERILKETLTTRPLIGSWTALMDYLKVAMQHEPAEHFRILFLDRKNLLIRDEVQSRGTVDHTPLYPREVVKRCLELAASAIIMVHNHPSGDPTPSPADIEMTRQVVAGLKQLGVAVHDHIIIGKSRHTSFRAERLIEGD